VRSRSRALHHAGKLANQIAQEDAGTERRVGRCYRSKQPVPTRLRPCSSSLQLVCNWQISRCSCSHAPVGAMAFSLGF
jgi:hypothetical protein